MTTGYASESGRNYILVINKALSMPSLDHSSSNPNQIRYHGTDVEDNLFSEEPMHIAPSDDSMVVCLQHRGAAIYIDTWTPTDSDLESYPRIVSTSPH